MLASGRRGARARQSRYFLLAALLLAPVNVRGQSVNGALDVLFPTGARATSMGTAVAAEQGGEALWWNPAGIARLTKPEFALDHFATFVVESGDAASFILPAGPVGVFAISGRLLNYGTTTNKDVNNVELGTSSVRSVVFGGTFAAAFGDRVSAGVTFRLYRLTAPCSGVCYNVVVADARSALVDAGIQFQPSLASPFSFGAVLSNVGPDLQVHDQPQADALPARLHLGMSYRPTSSQWDPALRVRTSIEFVATPSLSRGEVHLGGEVGYVSGQATLYLRGGYIYEQSGGPESSVGPSLGFGIASGRVQLDFAQVFDSFSTGLGKPPRYVSIRIGL